MKCPYHGDELALVMRVTHIEDDETMVMVEDRRLSCTNGLAVVELIIDPDPAPAFEFHIDGVDPMTTRIDMDAMARRAFQRFRDRRP